MLFKVITSFAWLIKIYRCEYITDLVIVIL